MPDELRVGSSARGRIRNAPSETCSSQVQASITSITSGEASRRCSSPVLIRLISLVGRYTEKICSSRSSSACSAAVTEANCTADTSSFTCTLAVVPITGKAMRWRACTAQALLSMADCNERE